LTAFASTQHPHRMISYFAYEAPGSAGDDI
jgi:hypothetical protein